MSLPTETSAPTGSLPQTDVPARRVEPAGDPLREAREVAEAVRIDCLVTPDKYLDEIRVVGGGE